MLASSMATLGKGLELKIDPPRRLGHYMDLDQNFMDLQAHSKSNHISKSNGFHDKDEKYQQLSLPPLIYIK